jgi:hypothetical protein
MLLERVDSYPWNQRRQQKKIIAEQLLGFCDLARHFPEICEILSLVILSSGNFSSGMDQIYRCAAEPDENFGFWVGSSSIYHLRQLRSKKIARTMQQPGCTRLA